MPDPVGPVLWGTTEIAERLSVTRERARQLTKLPTWPAPLRHGGKGVLGLWRADLVEAWIARYRPDDVRDAEDELPELWSAADVARHVGVSPHEVGSLLGLPRAMWRHHGVRLYVADEIRAWATGRS